MSSAAGGRPVARSLSPVVVRLAALVVVIAVVAVLGTLVSVRSVDDLTGELQPAAAAHQDVLVDLVELDAAVSRWARSGDAGAQDDFDQARSRLDGHLQQVTAYSSSAAGELDFAVAREQLQIEQWLEQTALPRIQAEGGPDTFSRREYRESAAAFDEVRASHLAATEVFDELVRDADAETDYRLRGTIATVLLLAVLALWLAGRSRRRMLDEVATPLADLEAVVKKMTKDPMLRARPAGPREVRAIATALNELADAQMRAGAVEAKIQASLQTLDTARDDFVSNVSHELRTPLTTISGYLEMVAEEFEGQMAPRHERILVASRRNVSRLKALIDDLLTLSKAESRHSVMEPIDLVPLVRETVTDVQITAAGREVRVTLSAPDEVLAVAADRPMLGRALLNVLTNAVKFSLEATTVEVSTYAAGDHVVVHVADHGIGIPADEVERLGSRFFRASNAVPNEIAGTGLGLRIVQTIVDKHGGDVRIESTEGEGTTVTLRLPRTDRTPRPLAELEAEVEPDLEAGLEEGPERG